MSKSSNIKFDIVDETGNADAKYTMFANYGILRGGNDTITNIVSQIDAYNNEQIQQNNQNTPKQTNQKMQLNDVNNNQSQQPPQIIQNNKINTFYRSPQQQMNIIQLNEDQQQGRQQLNLPHHASFKVAEFNLMCMLFGRPTLKQLFSQSQAVNTQMQNVKWKTDNELTPTLMQLGQQMYTCHTNPGLLQLPQHFLQCTEQIKQMLLRILSQINQMQTTYIQLQTHLKYTQYMDEISQLNDTNNNMYTNNNTSTIQLNPLQPTHTNTVNLTQCVTDVIVIGGEWQSDNTNNESTNNIMNKMDEQPQEQHDNFNNNIENQEDSVAEHQEEYIRISVPLYPFPTHLDFHDFTINSLHINLYQVLINNHDAKSIDYNWECKIPKKYDK
eukprot:189513_1